MIGRVFATKTGVKPGRFSYAFQTTIYGHALGIGTPYLSAVGAAVFTLREPLARPPAMFTLYSFPWHLSRWAKRTGSDVPKLATFRCRIVFVRARRTTAHGNVVLVTRKRSHKNGGKPIPKRIRRACRVDFSADPRPISRCRDISEIYSPTRRLSAGGGGCRTIV